MNKVKEKTNMRIYPALILLRNMTRNQNTTELQKHFRSAFLRTAKPYSGSALRGRIQAKLGLGLRFTKLVNLANQI